MKYLLNFFGLISFCILPIGLLGYLINFIFTGEYRLTKYFESLFYDN